MYVSVIIVTFNRFESLQLVLRALSQQTYADFEVIVVDDGSTDNTSTVAMFEFPFKLTYVKQSNRGATMARNLGATRAQGDLLIFIDDDIELASEAIAVLVKQHRQQTQSIIVGTLLAGVPADTGGNGERIKLDFVSSTTALQMQESPVPIDFVECFTGLLSVRRSHFFTLGKFQDPTGGWPNWDDVDFGYRAYRAGYRILRSTAARAIHHDAAATSLHRTAERWYKASKSAVKLFQKYPEIQPHVPMLGDKTPIVWGKDPLSLISRKLLRHLASSRPALASVEQLVRRLEQYYPSPVLLRPLYRWVNGGYMFRGYREGLRELQRAEGK